MTDLLNQQLNSQLTSLPMVSDQWIQMSEQIWQLITTCKQSRQYVLTPVITQNLLLSLLLNEITESNVETMPALVRRQTSQLMKHLNHQEGIVVQRFFKQYLL